MPTCYPCSIVVSYRPSGHRRPCRSGTYGPCQGGIILHGPEDPFFRRSPRHLHGLGNGWAVRTRRRHRDLTIGSSFPAGRGNSGFRRLYRCGRQRSRSDRFLPRPGLGRPRRERHCGSFAAADFQRRRAGGEAPITSGTVLSPSPLLPERECILPVSAESRWSAGMYHFAASAPAAAGKLRCILCGSGLRHLSHIPRRLRPCLPACGERDVLPIRAGCGFNPRPGRRK